MPKSHAVSVSRQPPPLPTPTYEVNANDFRSHEFNFALRGGGAGTHAATGAAFRIGSAMRFGITPAAPGWGAPTAIRRMRDVFPTASSPTSDSFTRDWKPSAGPAMKNAVVATLLFTHVIETSARRPG